MKKTISVIVAIAMMLMVSIPAFAGNFDAVSYTHLDVYKRQNHNRFAHPGENASERKSTTERVAVRTAVRQNQNVVFTFENFCRFGLIYPLPVSYTHLKPSYV